MLIKYREVISKHSNVYVTKDFVSFRIGTKEEARRHGWISMKEARKDYKNEEDFLEALLAVTTYTEEEKLDHFKKDKP